MIGVTYKDSVADFPKPLEAPESAPNILLVILDDVGFGWPSAFGGLVRMPTAERLAAQGLSYIQFHTTAICSPTRQAPLTGRNHHSCGMAAPTEMATSAPGARTVLPNTISPIARTLKLKCHEVIGTGTSHLGFRGIVREGNRKKEVNCVEIDYVIDCEL